MSLARVIFALLASKALASTFVRKQRMAAEDKDSIKQLSSVDAKTAQNMLAEVEQMAQSHSKVDKPKIATIQELTQQLEKALDETHQSAEKEVGINLVAIKKCNDAQAAKITDIKATTKVQVNEERKAHATCREGEIEKHEDMVKKCKHLKDWLKGLSGPEKAGSDDDEMVEFVGQMDKYWCPKGDEAKEKSKTCKKAKSDHAAEKAKCDPLQSQFELGFCTFRVEMIDACAEQTTCYDKAVAAYKVHKADTKKLIIQWKTEYAALKKISCYVNVWLSDDNANTVDADKLSACQNFAPDDSNMDIDFGSPADKAECSLADVAKYPGTEEFKQEEYKKFLDIKQKIGDDKLYHFINEPNACEGVETTVAPQTEAPTPAPTEAPTKAPVQVTCKLTIDNYLTGVKYNGKTLTTTYVSNGKVYTYATNSETVAHKDHHWNKPKTFSFTDAGAGVDLDISGFEHDKVGSFHGCKNAGLALECTASDPTSPWNKYGSDLSTWKAKGADTPSGLAAANFAKPCETSSGFHLPGNQGFHKEIWPSNGKRYAEFSGSPEFSASPY